jgi:hypothetical protein
MAIEAQHSPAANYVGTFLLRSPSIHACAYIFWEYLITSMSMAACCSLSVDRRHRWPPAAILSETTTADSQVSNSNAATTSLSFSSLVSEMISDLCVVRWLVINEGKLPCFNKSLCTLYPSSFSS